LREVAELRRNGASELVCGEVPESDNEGRKRKEIDGESDID